MKTTGEIEAAEAATAILNNHCRGALYYGVDDTGFAKWQQISDSTKKELTIRLGKSEKTVQKIR